MFLLWQTFRWVDHALWKEIPESRRLHHENNLHTWLRTIDACTENTRSKLSSKSVPPCPNNTLYEYVMFCYSCLISRLSKSRSNQTTTLTVRRSLFASSRSTQLQSVGGVFKLLPGLVTFTSGFCTGCWNIQVINYRTSFQQCTK